MKAICTLLFLLQIGFVYCQKNKPIQEFENAIRGVDYLNSRWHNVVSADSIVNKSSLDSVTHNLKRGYNITSLRRVNHNLIDVNGGVNISTLNRYTLNDSTPNRFGSLGLKPKKILFAFQAFHINQVLPDTASILFEKNHRVGNMLTSKYSNMLKSYQGDNLPNNNFDETPFTILLPNRLNSTGTVLSRQISHGNLDMADKETLTSLPNSSIPDEINLKKDIGAEAELLSSSTSVVSSEVKTVLTNNAPQSAAEITETKLEEKAKEVIDTNENVKNVNPLEQYQEMLNQIKKEKGAISGIDIKKELPDPFLNKEEKLQLGIAELDKLKRKYIDIPDSRYLPKRVPNAMKGKPFKQRFVPGFNFQLLDGSKWGVDLMPYFVYKVSGRLRLGLGFDYRLVSDNQTFFSSAQVFGFRVLGDVRMYGTWYFHLEGEWLHFDRQNTSQTRFISDPTVHEWGDRLNIGILRTYKVSRRFNGTFQALYYAGDWKSFPQTRNTSIRVGFEYNLGEKKKSPAMR